MKLANYTLPLMVDTSVATNSTDQIRTETNILTNATHPPIIARSEPHNPLQQQYLMLRNKNPLINLRTLPTRLLIPTALQRLN
jgi:hypothetical protein